MHGKALQRHIESLCLKEIAPLDFLPEGSLPERIIALMLGEVPELPSSEVAARFARLVDQINAVDTDTTRVVVFGGGTGLSNLVGGDSRRQGWRESPFTGLKEFFARIHAIVCITDDGGSTGELLKDLPLIGLGDLRHVLLSSVRSSRLAQQYQVDRSVARLVAGELFLIFNYRFISHPPHPSRLLRDTGANLDHLPASLRAYFLQLCERLFTDERLSPVLRRPQCLGNLLLASAIYGQLDAHLDRLQLEAGYQVVRTATIRGLAEIASRIGAQARSVLPCTTTNAQLQILYENGVLVTSEYKSSVAQRGYAVDRVQVEFCRQPFLSPDVVDLIQQADIIVFAPGSLYTSIIPILQVPGMAEAVRSNRQALKLLVSNIWVQKGETDVSRHDPSRRFYVSDLIRAYHRNIPGGVEELFTHVLSLNLRDVPGSVLQNYVIENKEPIYLDRARVSSLGFEPVEACIFSKTLLARRRVIQHAPDALAQAIKVLWVLNKANQLALPERKTDLAPASQHQPLVRRDHQLLCQRYEAIESRLQYLRTEQITVKSTVDQQMSEHERRWILEMVTEILWSHPDILLEHLDYTVGITLVDSSCWVRCQQWDNVFSFFDPLDRQIKIRQDQATNPRRFEMALLVALGQSLLGNYVEEKYMQDLFANGEQIGRQYNIICREERHLQSFFNLEAIDRYLQLARMRPSQTHPRCYTRLINAREGFTPPGLLFGLFYAWYLDNRFATNIEYKMSIMRNEISDLIPEQVRIVARRERLIRFFREHVFRQQIAAPLNGEH